MRKGNYTQKRLKNCCCEKILITTNHFQWKIKHFLFERNLLLRTALHTNAILRSDWLSDRTLSTISVQWPEVITK